MRKYKTKSEETSYNEFMTPKELACYLGFHCKTIYSKIKNHEIPAVRIFDSWRFRKADIEKWIESCSNMNKKMEEKWKRKRKS